MDKASEGDNNFNLHYANLIKINMDAPNRIKKSMRHILSMRSRGRDPRSKSTVIILRETPLDPRGKGLGRSPSLSLALARVFQLVPLFSALISGFLLWTLNQYDHTYKFITSSHGDQKLWIMRYNSKGNTTVRCWCGVELEEEHYFWSEIWKRKKGVWFDVPFVFRVGCLFIPQTLSHFPFGGGVFHSFVWISFVIFSIKDVDG